MKKIKNKESVYDKKYFTDYYYAMTGEFTSEDLRRNKNWFIGWFRALQKLYDFRNGNGKKALEIGASIAAPSALLAERGFKVTATDISPYAVKKAKKLLPHISFDVMDIQQKPLKKYINSFDVIIAFEVIEHLNKPDEALTNLYTMLKTGGSLICSTPYPYPYVYFDETHISVKYPNDWAMLYKKSGFKKVTYMQRAFIPFFYRFSPLFHLILPFGFSTRYVNSPIFIYGKKE